MITEIPPEAMRLSVHQLINLTGMNKGARSSAQGEAERASEASLYRTIYENRYIAISGFMHATQMKFGPGEDFLLDECSIFVLEF